VDEGLFIGCDGVSAVIYYARRHTSWWSARATFAAARISSNFSPFVASHGGTGPRLGPSVDSLMDGLLCVLTESFMDDLWVPFFLPKFKFPRAAQSSANQIRVGAMFLIKN